MKFLRFLFWEYIYSNPDSALPYINKGLDISKRIYWIKGITGCLNDKGYYYLSTGDYNTALNCYNESLRISKKNNYEIGIGNSYTCIGNVLSDQGKYDKALENYLYSAKYLERLNNKRELAYCYNNIGLVYESMKCYDKALKYYDKTIEIVVKLNDVWAISCCYNNIANIYDNLNENKKALDYYLKAVENFEKLGNKRGMSACYSNIGTVYTKLKIYNKSAEYYKKSLVLKKEIGDKNGLALLYGNMAALNNSIGDSLKNKKEKKYYYSKAITNGIQALEIAKDIKAVHRENEAAGNLLKSYKELNNPLKALEYAEMFISTKDSMFKDEKTKAITEMETKYQSEKKQLEIEKLGKQKELDKQTIIAQTAENKEQRILIISFVFGFIFVLLFSILLIRLFLQKKKANILLGKQNVEILQQKEEISTQRDEIEEQRDEIEAQRDLVTIQKEEIEEIHKEVTDSINYARRIQEAVLPVSDIARSVLGNHFILFKPKDIVSGDFYWNTKINKWLIVAVADCTGHGVPGAFMSMLGISFLNEIVQKKEINKANQILNILRKEVINALQQKGVHGEQKDGMDISLLVINKDTNECQWAGANNPLYVVRKFIKSESKKLEENNFQLSNFQLDELKGDKMPIAIYPEMKDFTNHEFVLQKGDSVYLFTDGYADQFGGAKGRKFMYKKLKELLVNNCDKSMIEQKEILELNFNNWIGSFEQIDDITILGIRI